MPSLLQTKLNIYSSFTLSGDDVATLSLLYASLIGHEAVGLYLAFQSLLERNNLKSEAYLHGEIFDMFDYSEKKFLKYRYQLEGIGLWMSYQKGDQLLYVLCPPLSAKNFLKDATLGLYLYSKVGKEVFDRIIAHFKIEKIEKGQYTNVTKTFEEVFQTQIKDDPGYGRFEYLLGKRPKSNLKIKNQTFDFDQFKSQINLDFLETGLTKQFIDQIQQLAFVYAFDESQMATLYNESINKRGSYDYRLLKKKANVLYTYLHHQSAPRLLTKEDDDALELIDYLEKTSPSDLLEAIYPNFPPNYLSIINEIYAQIDLPRGVLNCMIIRVMKDKGGELPQLAYFKKMSQTWIADNVLSTADAIDYSTRFEEKQKQQPDRQYTTGGFESL